MNDIGIITYDELTDGFEGDLTRPSCIETLERVSIAFPSAMTRQIEKIVTINVICDYFQTRFGVEGQGYIP
jgi:hypothetical protein